MGFAGPYGTAPSREEQFKILDRAFELGETFWDTADIYGDNEKMLGEWFKRTGKRDKIFLASKFGVIMDKFQMKGVNTSAEYCKRCCGEALEKLGTDYIDLYYAHHINPETPIEETMQALAELQAEGKIRHIGLCGISSATLRRACKIAPVAAVQFEYSPFEREIETEAGTHILQTCRELGVAVVCYAPLGRGLLTGVYHTKAAVGGAGDTRSTYFPRFNDENMETNALLVSQFKALADKKNCSASQLALAWLLKQGEDIIPIPGTKRIKYLEENWAALDISLTDKEEAEIRKFLESVEVAGYRSVPETKALAFVDTKEA